MEDSVKQERNPLLDKSLDDFDDKELEETETLAEWMKLHIKRPPKGYSSQTNEDGTPLTEAQQIDAAIGQITSVIEDNKKIGFPIRHYSGAIREAILGLTSAHTGPSLFLQPSSPGPSDAKT